MNGRVGGEWWPINREERRARLKARMGARLRLHPRRPNLTRKDPPRLSIAARQLILAAAMTNTWAKQVVEEG